MPILPNIGPITRMVLMVLGVAAALYGLLAVEDGWLRMLCAVVGIWFLTEGIIGFDAFVSLMRGRDKRR